MTEIDAVYAGGVFRPAGPVPLADGQAVRLTVVPAVPPDEWERRVRAAASFAEWRALADAGPADEPDFDILKAINDSRRATGFRVPDPETP